MCTLINLEKIYLSEDSYEINNLDKDCLIKNLPYGLKSIYLSK
jgi:hypothetical protein